jgi:hypothetical protein
MGNFQKVKASQKSLVDIFGKLTGSWTCLVVLERPARLILKLGLDKSLLIRPWRVIKKQLDEKLI